MGTVVIREVTEAGEGPVHYVADTELTLYDMLHMAIGVAEDGTEIPAARHEVIAYYPGLRPHQLKDSLTC